MFKGSLETGPRRVDSFSGLNIPYEVLSFFIQRPAPKTCRRIRCLLRAFSRVHKKHEISPIESILKSDRCDNMCVIRISVLTAYIFPPRDRQGLFKWQREKTLQHKKHAKKRRRVRLNGRPMHSRRAINVLSNPLREFNGDVLLGCTTPGFLQGA